MEKLRTNWNPNIYQKIQKPKIKIQSRIGKIKNNLNPNIYQNWKPKEWEKNLNSQCSKERKKRKEVTCEKRDWWWINSKTGFPNQNPQKKKKTMKANIRKQTMEMQREIDAVAVIRGGDGDGGDSSGRNWVLGFDFGGRKWWVLS